MLDPIQKCFGYSQLWPVCSQNWTGSFICLIQLPASSSVSFFQRRHGSYIYILYKTDLDGLSGFDDTSGLEPSWCAGVIGPGFWQDATSPLPVFHFQTQLQSSTDVPGDTMQNQPRSDLVLADCVRFWPNRSGPEASWCARIIWP